MIGIEDLGLLAPRAFLAAIQSLLRIRRFGVFKIYVKEDFLGPSIALSSFRTRFAEFGMYLKPVSVILIRGRIADVVSGSSTCNTIS